MDFTLKEIIILLFSGVGAALITGFTIKKIKSKNNNVQQNNNTVTNGDIVGRDKKQ